MVIDTCTPVIVGAGQAVIMPDGRHGEDLSARPEPADLMIRAVLAAAEDCTGARSGDSTGAGHSLLARVQSLRVVNVLSWNYVSPGVLVAEALGIEPAEIMLTTPGGNNPQRLVNHTALAIGRGDVDAAVIVGADCGYTQAAAREHPDRPVLPWTVQNADTERPTVFGNDRRPTTDAEVGRGLDVPTHVFPLFENALRSEARRGLDEHRDRIGALWSRLSDVAVSNPYAWLREALDGETITAVSASNPMIAYPYTKLLTANMQVDQGAALIMCSAGLAESAGVPRDRWVFPLAGADADDHWFLSHRADFHSSPAIRMAGGCALALSGTDIEQVAHLDLCPSFPSAVEITAAELGLPIDHPDRPLTVTGGLTFAGAPGSNYGTHAIATMVSTLRADPGSIGLVSGLGWYVTEHSIGIYGTEPGEPASGRAGRVPDGAVAWGVPDGTVVEEAGGFRWADPQAVVGALPQCSPDADARGEVTVETYSVAYERDGTPSRGVVACRTPDGRRAWATTTDADDLAMLVTEEGCGRLGTLHDDGNVDLH